MGEGRAGRWADLGFWLMQVGDPGLQGWACRDQVLGQEEGAGHLVVGPGSSPRRAHVVCACVCNVSAHTCVCPCV